MFFNTRWMLWQIMPFDAGLLIFAHYFIADQTLWLRTFRYKIHEIIHFPIFLKCTDCIVSVFVCIFYRSRPHFLMNYLRSVHSRPHCGRHNAADYKRRNAFLAFITNAADAGPMHYDVHSRPQRAAHARPTLRPTMNRP